jgi:hypothetical protein
MDRENVYDRRIALAGDGPFGNGKIKRLNNGGVDVLSDRQYRSIVVLLRLAVLMPVTMVMTVARAVGVNVRGMILSRCGKPLEEMVHPMGRGCRQKKTKGGGNAQV